MNKILNFSNPVFVELTGRGMSIYLSYLVKRRKCLNRLSDNDDGKISISLDIYPDNKIQIPLFALFEIFRGHDILSEDLIKDNNIEIIGNE